MLIYERIVISFNLARHKILYKTIAYFGVYSKYQFQYLTVSFCCQCLTEMWRGNFQGHRLVK